MNIIICCLCTFLMGIIGPSMFLKLLQSIKYYIFIYTTNREFDKKMNNLEKMKEKGELHDWVELNFTDGTILMCKKTGWCPSLKTFYKIKDIEYLISKQKINEKYKLLAFQEMDKVLIKYNITRDNIVKLQEEISEIENKLTEMQNKEMEKI